MPSLNVITLILSEILQVMSSSVWDTLVALNEGHGHQPGSGHI